jgi:hypothetical protein
MFPCLGNNGTLKLRAILGNKVGEGLLLNNPSLTYIPQPNTNNSYNYHLINLLRIHHNYLPIPYQTQIIN